MPGQNVSAIKVDTVGYPSGWTKLAVFNVDLACAGMARAAERLTVSAELAVEGRRVSDAEFGPGILHRELRVGEGPGDGALGTFGALHDPVVARVGSTARPRHPD